MNHWKIKVFINNRGTNVIKEWLKDLPKAAQAEIDNRLKYMQTLKTWGRPYSAKLKGSDHIHEVRIKCQKVQYRPLGFFGPTDGVFTLLVGAREKDSKLEPKNAQKSAEERRELILTNERFIDDYFKKV